MRNRIRQLLFTLAALTLAAIAVAGALRLAEPKAPPLTNAYGSLAGYWDQLAAAVGADPGQTYLNTWNLTYGPGGSVQELSLQFLVEEGGRYTWYNYRQQGTDRPRLTASHKGERMPKGPFPARIFFEQLDAAGLPALEASSGQEPPVRIWLHAIHGSILYGQRVGTHVIANGQITPVGPEGITLRGGHGTFHIGRNDTGSKPNLLYVVPAAVSP